MGKLHSRHYIISGRVQGVGYRDFAQRSAKELGIAASARNLDDGTVEVHATGTERQLDDFESRLRQGPRLADVRSVVVEPGPRRP